MKKRILGLLCSLALLVTMLPVSALASETQYTFATLQSTLLNSNGTGIYFEPSADFDWPMEGGTLTFQQNLYLEDDWNIPANITLEFPKSGCGIRNSNANEIHTVTINGPVHVTAQSNDQFINGCNVVLQPGSAVQMASDTASLYIDKECTWTVAEDVTLTPWIRLDGTLTGAGTVSGQVDIRGGFGGGNSNGVISGSLTLTGPVQIGSQSGTSQYSDKLTIPVGSNISYQPAERYNTMTVNSGATLCLNGNLDISGSAIARTTGLGFDDRGCLKMGTDSILSLHYPYELGCQNPGTPQQAYVTGSGTIKYYADDVESIDRYCLFSRDLTDHDMPFETVKNGLIPAYIAEGVTIWRSWDSGHEHSWGAWQTVTDATCTTEGLEERACQDAGCTAKETRPIPALGHALTYSASENSLTITQKCTRDDCGHSATATLSANDATYTGSPIEANISYTGEWSGAAPSLRYADGNVNAGPVTVYATADDTEIYLAYTINPATSYTVSLGNLSQYSGSVSAVTWATNPPDTTAKATVEYQVTIPEKPCTHVHDENCGANGENCQHQHDATCGYEAAKTEWTTTLPTAVGSYPVRVKLTGSDNLALKADAGYTTGTLTISTRSSSGGSSSSGNKTETTTNPDGSTTTTVTQPDGSTTETTKHPDGSTEVVDTKKDGTVTTTTTDKDGNKTAVTENTDGTTQTTITNTNGTSSTTTKDADGKTETTVKLPASIVADAADKGETVALPMPEVNAASDSADAPTVTVDLSGRQSAKVEIPVAGVTPGTVAVLVDENGDEQIVMNSIPTENGVAVTLASGETVKIVDNSKDFADVADSYWGADAVAFATGRELFNGTSSTTFEPDGAMNRAMIVTVLARYEGVDTTTGDTWYDVGRDWAMQAGISDGTNMEQDLTREQLATMLYRYAQGKGQGFAGAWAFQLDYPDADAVSDYAHEALCWTTMHGIINGMGDGSLAPQGAATRAQVATMLMRFIENIA